jgi:hypothetical protein
MSLLKKLLVVKQIENKKELWKLTVIHISDQIHIQDC